MMVNSSAGSETNLKLM